MHNPPFDPLFFPVQTSFSNHGYVETIHFILLKLQILSFGVAAFMVRSGLDTNHLVYVRKKITFWL